MTMTQEDLSREFMIDVCANGSVHIRDRGGRAVKGTLPVFSTNTHEEAESLRVYHCRLARDGSGLYFLNERPSSVEDLGRVSEMFRASWEGRNKSTAQRLRDAAEKGSALAS